MNFLHWLKVKLLTILGDIKVYKFPFFLIYDPSTFRVKGYHTRQAMNFLKPGDIILRRYRMYLDGMFIPGKYSHTGVYVGDGKIIHAVAEGVSEIDVIDFLRCDGFCILRQSDQNAALKAVEYVRDVLGQKGQYDFDFKDENGSWYCHELGAKAYPDAGLEMKASRIMGFKVAPRWLAASFLECESFSKILEV